MIPQSYNIRRIECKIAKQYIHKYHYSKGSHNGPSPCYGLFDNDNLIGCLMFATPCSENVRKSLFSELYKNSVVELHRFHIQDCTPKNTESWFIARCIKELKKDRPITLGIISFADPTEGHTGTIYKATNFILDGTSSPARFYRDCNGRLRHPRQSGVNISIQQAKEWGWTIEPRMGKLRYIMLLNKKAKFLFKQYRQNAKI